LIEISTHEARGESYFVAQHTLPTDAGGTVEMFASGRYLDSFSRRDGAWRISHRHAIYDWNTSEPSTSGWESEPMVSRLVRGARGQADPSFAHFASLT